MVSALHVDEWSGSDPSPARPRLGATTILAVLLAVPVMLVALLVALRVAIKAATVLLALRSAERASAALHRGPES
jgi:hypothetical protein